MRLQPDGAFVYTPTLTFTGSDSFTYQTSDGVSPSDSATVLLTFKPTSQTPVFTSLNPTGVQILSADVAEGMGAFTFIPHFRLVIPGNTTIGDGNFSTVVTVTMIVGP